MTWCKKTKHRGKCYSRKWKKRFLDEYWGLLKPWILEASRWSEFRLKIGQNDCDKNREIWVGILMYFLGSCPRRTPTDSSTAVSLARKQHLSSDCFVVIQPSSTYLTKRCPRETVLSTPLIGSLLNSSIAQKRSRASQETFHQWGNDMDNRPSSSGYQHHNPRPQYVRGSVSNTSVPGNRDTSE